MKHQRWGGSQAEMPPKGAPMLGFGIGAVLQPFLSGTPYGTAFFVIHRYGKDA